MKATYFNFELFNIHIQGIGMVFITFSDLTYDQQKGVVLAMEDLEPWEVEHGRYEIDPEDGGVWLIEARDQ